MSELIDLSKLGKEERDRVLALAKKAGVTPKEAPAQEVTTAFLVYQQRDGQVIATSDLALDLAVDRLATGDDMSGLAAIVQRDVAVQLSVQATVQNTLMAFQQMGAQIQQQQQAAQIRSNLKL